jgi:hypothetical protein
MKIQPKRRNEPTNQTTKAIILVSNRLTATLILSFFPILSKLPAWKGYRVLTMPNRNPTRERSNTTKSPSIKASTPRIMSNPAFKGFEVAIPIEPTTQPHPQHKKNLGGPKNETRA